MGCTSSAHSVARGCQQDAKPRHNGLGGGAHDVQRQPRPQDRALGVDSQQSFHDSYELMCRLGSGAFASVHLARRASCRGGQAVKILDLRRAEGLGAFDGQVDVRRCQHAWEEVEMLQRVRGKAHVVQFADAFFEGGLAYIVMESCDSTLLQVLEQMPQLNEASLKRVFREMLEGLAGVHQLGIAHRDVKPDNFLCFGADAQVKLCDFGFASRVAMNGAESGLVGSYGTPPFIAPEMLRGVRYDTRVDIWSLGVIAYVLHLGEFPYMPKQLTSAAMKAAIRHGTPEPSFRPSRALQDVGACASTVANGFLRMTLSRRPEERPSAAELLASDFFTSDGDAHGPPDASLRPVLQAAKHVGAFDLLPRSGNSRTDVDVRLASLQVQRKRFRKHRESVEGGVFENPVDKLASAAAIAKTVSPINLDDGADSESVGSTYASEMSP